MIIRSIIITAIMFILAACQTTGDTTRPSGLQAGMPVSELVNRYGKPRAVEERPDGATYVWQLSSGRLVNTENRRSGAYSSMSGNYNPQVVLIFCQLSVITDSSGQVSAWQAEGEGCRQILYNRI